MTLRTKLFTGVVAAFPCWAGVAYAEPAPPLPPPPPAQHAAHPDVAPSAPPPPTATAAPYVPPPPPPPPSSYGPPPRPAPPAFDSSASAAPPAVSEAAPPPAPVPGPSREELRERRVAVTIDASRPSAVVERRISTTEGGGVFIFDTFGSTWEQVCVTPCRTHLDKFSTYRVRAQNGIAQSRPFTLPQREGALDLHVDAGWLLGHRAGKALVTLGTAAVVVGVALVAGAHVFSNEDHAREAGFITGGAGLVLLGAGIPISILTSTRITSGGHCL